MDRNLKLEVLLQAIDRATGPFKKISQQSSRAAKALKANRDELRQLDRAQKDMRGWQQLKRQSQQTAAALSTEQRRVAELTREIQAGTGNVAALTRERNKAIRASRTLTQRQQAEQQQLQQLRDRIRSVSGLTGTMADRQRQLAQRTAEANQRMQDQQRRLARLAEQQRKLDAARSRYDKSRQRASAMAGAGARGMAVGGAALYSGSRLMAPGIDFGAGMSYVQALTRLDKDDPRLAALKQQARELGASTAFSATQAAEAMGFLGMAGFNPDAIMAAMPGMLDLALANKTDLAQTADISSNILSGFGLDPAQMTRVGDVLTATTTRANVNLAMLGDTMKYVAPVARELGVSLEESAAMAGMLGNVGIQGSQAGTSMRAIVSRLAAPVGKAATAMEKLKVSSRDAQGNMRNVPAIIADIARATEKMGSGERFEYLQQIFGREPAAAIAELVEQQGSAGIEKFVDILKNSAGENARAARVLADNVSGDLKGLVSAWEEVGITIQDVNDGALRGLIQRITDVVRRVGEWMNANPELTRRITITIGAVAGLVAVGGALTLMLASILGPIALLRYSLTVLGIKSLPSVLAGVRALLGFLLANPIGLAIAAIAGGAYLIWKNWDWIGPRFFALWDGIKATGLALWEELKAGFSGGIGSIAETILNFSPLGLFYRAFAGVLDWFGLTLPDRFSDFGRMMLTGLIDGIKSMAGLAKDAISSVADGVTGWFKEKLGIRSPSRVFATAGRDTLDGYQLGLAQAEQGPLKQVSDFSKRLRQAGAGIALGAAALPAAAGIQFDSRPPIAASAAAAQAVAGDTITINIYAAPGMDEAAIARQVELVLAKRDREKAARRRSALYDTE